MSDGPCSACGRTAEGPFFAARPGGNPALSLCHRCVAECAMAIEDAPTRIPGAQHACEFCGKAEGNVAVIVAVGTRKVCDECVDAYSGR